MRELYDVPRVRCTAVLKGKKVLASESTLNQLEMGGNGWYTVVMETDKELDEAQLNKKDAEDTDDAVKEASDRVDWEASTLGALRFSLQDQLSRLKFRPGLKLNAKRREIDCIVIDKKRASGGKIDNDIAAIFRRHNVVEFKNPSEPLNIDTVWKVISYAAQYKSAGGSVNEIRADEVTMTILRVSRPTKLLKMLENDGFGVKREFPGVYYITGMVCMPMQIVVGSELDGEEFRAFRILKKRAKKEDIKKFIFAVKGVKGYWRKTLVEAARNIIDVCAAENKETFERLKKEDYVMSTALEEIMADDIQKKIQKEVTNVSEEIAKRMIKKKKPMSEIVEFTNVTDKRLGQLAKALNMTLVTG